MKHEVTLPYKVVSDVIPKQCLQNCERRVEQSGGKIVVGWQIDEFGYYRTETHHVAWEDPEGTLWEITPTLLTFTETGLVGANLPTRFIADPKAKFLGEAPNRRSLPSKYVPKHDDPALYRAAEYLGRSDDAIVNGDRAKGLYWQDRAQDTINQFAKRTRRPLICLDPSPIPEGATMGRESSSDVQYLDPQTILSSAGESVE